MPNGGTHHCAHCHHFKHDVGRCGIRDIEIISTHWTTCRNWNVPSTTPIGPVFSIVCEVKSGAGGYGDIPWFDGCRVDTEQSPNGGDTVVVFTDRSGTRHEFQDVAAYVSFWKKNSQETDSNV